MLAFDGFIVTVKLEDLPFVIVSELLLSFTLVTATVFGFAFEEVAGFLVVDAPPELVLLPELFLFEDELLLLPPLDEPEVLLPEVEELDFLLDDELVFDELLLFDDETAFLFSLAPFISSASTLTVFSVFGFYFDFAVFGLNLFAVLIGYFAVFVNFKSRINNSVVCF